MLAQRFNTQITTDFLTFKAQQGVFTSFVDITRHYGIADQDWPYIYSLLYRHLNHVVAHCFENKIPCLPVLAVAKATKKEGGMTPRQIKRLSKVMLQAGYRGMGTMEFMRRHQTECFEWAKRQYVTPENAELQNGRLPPAFPPSPPQGREGFLLKVLS